MTGNRPSKTPSTLWPPPALSDERNFCRVGLAPPLTLDSATIPHPMNPHHPLLAFTAAVFLSLAPALSANEPANPVTPDEAVARLQAGNKRFVANQVTDGKPVAARRAETAQSQHPF